MREEETPTESTDDTEGQRWPIGFMLLLGITALYLGWRLIQGLGALIAWTTG